MNPILELILVATKFISAERKNYFESKTKKLLNKIAAVEDSEFHKKDMESKGKAERQLAIEVEELRKEFIQEIIK
jgi:nitrogen fixation/metabolism regulation signal transduction histidine kinase